MFTLQDLNVKYCILHNLRKCSIYSLTTNCKVLWNICNKSKIKSEHETDMWQEVTLFHFIYEHDLICLSCLYGTSEIVAKIPKKTEHKNLENVRLRSITVQISHTRVESVTHFEIYCVSWTCLFFYIIFPVLELPLWLPGEVWHLFGPKS